MPNRYQKQLRLWPCFKNMIVSCINGGKGGRKKACYLSRTIHHQDMCVHPNFGRNLFDIVHCGEWEFTLWKVHNYSTRKERLNWEWKTLESWKL
jgi:hypothetical protein